VDHPDPSTIELTLRDGVKFSDGTAFNAAAVKQMWTGRSSPRPNRTDEIWPSPRSRRWATTSASAQRPLAKQFIGSDSRTRTSSRCRRRRPPPPATSTPSRRRRPYLLDSYSTGKLVLKKNPTFYDPAAETGRDRVRQHDPGPPAVGAAGRDSRLIWSIPPGSIETLKNAGGRLGAERRVTLGLCTTQGIFQSEKPTGAAVRRQPRRHQQRSARGNGAPAISPVPPSSPYYDKTAQKDQVQPHEGRAPEEAGIAPGTSVGADPNAAP
jgi:hypothetical protein